MQERTQKRLDFLIEETIKCEGRFESISKHALTCRSAYGKSQKTTYFVIENVGLDAILAICKKSLKNVPVHAIEQDFAIRSKSYRFEQMFEIVIRRILLLFRSVSPDRFIAKALDELNSYTSQCLEVAELAATDQWIYQIGTDLKSANVEMRAEIMCSVTLRERLLDPTIYPCLKCPQLYEHVRAIQFQCVFFRAKNAFLVSTNFSKKSPGGATLGTRFPDVDRLVAHETGVLFAHEGASGARLHRQGQHDWVKGQSGV